MRRTIFLLALASLSACGSNHDNDDAKTTLAATPAALSFDGAGDADHAKMLAHGERLSHILGCRGCHTETLEGQWFNDDAPENGRIYASNLTRVMPTMTDAQLESLLRTGVHPTRKDLWIMPSEVFQRLSGADMAALIAHLRTVKPSGKPTPPPVLSAKFRAAVAKGDEKPTAVWVADYKTHQPPDLGPTLALGRYVAGATCSECHGGDLTGIAGFTPDLDVAGTYSEAELTELLTTGKGKTPRDLGLMTLVGKEHFSFLTANEREAVIAYVKARAAR